MDFNIEVQIMRNNFLLIIPIYNRNIIMCHVITSKRYYLTRILDLTFLFVIQTFISTHIYKCIYIH